MAVKAIPHIDLAIEVLKRLARVVLVVWGAFTVTFALLYAVPGNYVTVLVEAGGGVQVSNTAVAALKHKLGIDKPFLVQYVDKLWQYLHLNFGTSIATGETVVTMIRQNLPETIYLTFAAMFLSIIFGLAFAAAVSYPDRSRIAKFLRVVPAFAGSLPNFWIALILLDLFSFRIHLFASAGNAGWDSVILPAITIAIPYAAVIAQVATDGILKSKAELYVMTARAKGVSRLKTHLKHVLPSSMIPTLSVIGINFGTLLAGAVITETVFSRQGIGTLLAQGVLQRDIPVVQGVIVVTAALYVLVNETTDVLYTVLDPRLRRVVSSS